jgi:hypothetical protein
MASIKSLQAGCLGPREKRFCLSVEFASERNELTARWLTVDLIAALILSILKWSWAGLAEQRSGKCDSLLPFTIRLDIGDTPDETSKVAHGHVVELVLASQEGPLQLERGAIAVALLCRQLHAGRVSEEG